MSLAEESRRFADVCGTIEALARRPREAYRGGVVSPLRDALPPDDVDVAYAVLARTLVDSGEPLRKCVVVLTGALGPLAAVKPGDHVEGNVGGLGSASFALRDAADA